MCQLRNIMTPLTKLIIEFLQGNIEALKVKAALSRSDNEREYITKIIAATTDLIEFYLKQKSL